MANIINNNNTGATFDLTQNRKIEEPVKGSTPSIAEQLGEPDPEFAPIPQPRDGQTPSEQRPKFITGHNDPVDLTRMTPVADVTSILPKREKEVNPLDNMLARNLDAAVERTKKQISQDQEAIMEKIYEEQQNMAIQAAEGDKVNIQNHQEPDQKIDDNSDDNDEDFDERDYIASNTSNTSGGNLFGKNEDPIEDKLYDPYEDMEEDSAEIKEEETAGASMSAEQLSEEINKDSKSMKTPEESAEEDKEKGDRLVKELTNQVKEKVGSTMRRIDISKFKVSKKPVSAAKAMKISNLNRAATADWVLLSAERPITVTGLSGAQIISLNNNNTNKNRLNAFRDMFKTLYDGIVDSNKPDFESWLKITKFSDVPHLYFAYYRATFEGSNFVHYTCTNEKCDKGVFIKDIKFDDMVKFPNEEFKKKFNNILSRDTTSPSKEYTIERIQISDNYVVDIASPSIWNVVIETASLSDSFLEKYGDLIDTVTYIDTIYLINHSTMELEPVEIKYDKNNQTSNASRKIRVFNDILRGLTSDQFFALRAAINELEKDSDQITYVVPGAVCPYCGATVDEQEMAPDTMLFTRHQLAAFASLPNS